MQELSANYPAFLIFVIQPSNTDICYLDYEK